MVELHIFISYVTYDCMFNYKCFSVFSVIHLFGWMSQSLRSISITFICLKKKVERLTMGVKR